MVTSPQVSWLFFKARAKCPYLIHTGRASNAEKQPTGCGPEGCVENGPAAALLVGYVSLEICALLAPCRRPILNATPSLLYARRYTRHRIDLWIRVRNRQQRKDSVAGTSIGLSSSRLPETIRSRFGVGEKPRL